MFHTYAFFFYIKIDFLHYHFHSCDLYQLCFSGHIKFVSVSNIVATSHVKFMTRFAPFFVLHGSFDGSFRSHFLPCCVCVLQVTDVTRPVCQEASSPTSCPSSLSLCASSEWEFIANLTDGINGTGIRRVTVRQGSGSLSTREVSGPGAESITIATYRASCCSPTVELIVVDRVGNVGTCTGQASQSTTAAPVTVTTPMVTATSNTSVSTTSRGHALSVSHCLWVSAAVCLLWK